MTGKSSRLERVARPQNPAAATGFDRMDRVAGNWLKYRDSRRGHAIDGSWCDEAGRHLAISGPKIVTPGGTEMQGQYTRHAFRYVVPMNEPSSGQGVDMQLLDENTVQLRVGEEGGPEVWRRCKPETS